jgi:RNA polymerase primary sigma factor
MRQSYNSLLSTTEENNLTTYFKEIRKIPLLTREQEEETARRVALGDEKAREKLINSNLQLGKGTKFSYYAYYWITDSILKALNQTYSSIRQSFGLNEKMTKMKKYLDWDYSIKQVAEIFKLSELQIEEFFGMRNEQYLEDPISSGDKKQISHLDMLKDESQNVAGKFFQGLEREAIMCELGKILDEKDLEILKMRHGFYFNLEYFLEDVGNFVGNISGERVRQRYNRAVKKVKENPHLKKIMASGVTR